MVFCELYNGRNVEQISAKVTDCTLKILQRPLHLAKNLNVENCAAELCAFLLDDRLTAFRVKRVVL